MKDGPDSVKTEGTYLTDFAIYCCSVGGRFREIQLESNVISWWGWGTETGCSTSVN